MADLFDSDTAFKVLEKSLDISAKRHGLITNNIANVDTIGYVPKDLDFKKALQEAMEDGSGDLFRTHPKHMEHRPETRAVKTKATRSETPGRDPVNIDMEMISLVENNIKYRTGVEMLLRKIGGLRHAITEGGR